MSAPSLYNFEVERQLNLEWFDTAKSILMPYAEHGFYGTFSGLFSDVLIEKIDLAELIGCNSSTHFIKVGGHSLTDESIISGDRVVIDESLPYEKGKKVAVWLSDFNGWTVKRLDITKRGHYLVSESSNFEYKIKSNDRPLGVVKSILYKEYNTALKTLKPSFFPEAEKKTVDVEKLLRPRSSSTFITKIAGNSLFDARLMHDDRIIIDKSLAQVDGKKIVYWLHEYQGYTVKILSVRKDGNYLVATNSTDSFMEYKIKEYDIPCGMVTWIIHKT